MPTWSPDGYARELGRRVRERRKQIRDAAYEVALEGVHKGADIAEDLKVVDRGIYKQRFKAKRTRRGAEIRNDAPHAGVIELGRRPGAKPPPSSVILSWIRRVGLNVTALANTRTRKRRKKSGKGRTKGRRQGIRKAQEQLAFLIARAIGRRGLPARAVFRGHLIPWLRRRWRAELRKIVRTEP